jgi:hypothetical protein
MRELQDAYAAPWVVADRWREDGGRVIGLVGNFAPRELVLGAGMLPIRLDADRLGRGESAGHQDDVVVAGLSLLRGLAGELPPPQLAVVEALISRELDWLDGVLIGRDSEAHTKLFYLLREMTADPEFSTFIPPFAFSDVLRLPARTSAVYNRRRLRELRRAVAGWGSGERGADELGAVIDSEIELDRAPTCCSRDAARASCRPTARRLRWRRSGRRRRRRARRGHVRGSSSPDRR